MGQCLPHLQPKQQGLPCFLTGNVCTCEDSLPQRFSFSVKVLLDVMLSKLSLSSSSVENHGNGRVIVEVVLTSSAPAMLSKLWWVQNLTVQKFLVPIFVFTIVGCEKHNLAPYKKFLPYYTKKFLLYYRKNSYCTILNTTCMDIHTVFL